MTNGLRQLLDKNEAKFDNDQSTERDSADGAVETAPSLEDQLIVFDGEPLPVHDLSTSELPPPEPDRPGAKVFKVRLARSRAVYDARALVQKRYAWRGYSLPTPNLEDSRITFIAYSQGVVVGTVSIRLDSDAGLAASSLYPEEIAELRNAGAKICEFTQLAVDKEAGSKPILAALFHTAYLFAYKVKGYNCAVIEVNPRHVPFYRRALEFQILGPERMHPRVQAPAVLLCVPFERIEQGLEQYGGNVDYTHKTHTLYPYGFPPEEEVGVLKRLEGLLEQELL